MNKGKILFWSLAGLVLIAGGAYAIKYFNKPEDKDEKTDEKSGGSSDVKSDTDSSNNVSQTQSLPKILANVKSQLGDAAVVKDGAIMARINNRKNWAIFYDNGRIVFKDNANNLLIKADYKDSGKKIITAKGRIYENSSVWLNMNKIIKDYGKLKNIGSTI